MSDTTQTAVATAVGNPSAPTQPASGQGNTLPPGGRTISEDDWNRLTRYEQQVKGFSPFQERLAKLGVKRPEDLDRFAATQQPEPRAEAQAEPPKPEDVSKLVRAELARERHAESRKSEGQLIEKLAKELAGEDADEFDLEDTRRVVASYLNELRADEKHDFNYYPADHPLHGEALAPLGDKHLEHAKGWFTERKTKREASRMQRAAEDASRPARPKPAPAGSSGGQGKPNDTPRSIDEMLDDAIKTARAGR